MHNYCIDFCTIIPVTTCLAYFHGALILPDCTFSLDQLAIINFKNIEC